MMLSSVSDRGWHQTSSGLLFPIEAVEEHDPSISAAQIGKGDGSMRLTSWLQGIGTILAVIVSILALVLSTQSADQQHKDAQYQAVIDSIQMQNKIRNEASLVTFRIHDDKNAITTLVLVVVNRSTTLVSDIYVSFSEFVGNDVLVSLPDLPPCSVGSAVIVSPSHTDRKIAEPIDTFADLTLFHLGQSGWWQSGTYLTPISYDPTNINKTVCQEYCEIAPDQATADFTAVSVASGCISS